MLSQNRFAKAFGGWQSPSTASGESCIPKKIGRSTSTSLIEAYPCAQSYQHEARHKSNLLPILLLMRDRCYVFLPCTYSHPLCVRLLDVACLEADAARNPKAGGEVERIVQEP